MSIKTIQYFFGQWYTELMQNKKVRIGAVGVGNRLVGVLRRLLEADTRIELVAIADPDVESREHARKSLGLPGLEVRELDAILEDESIEWLFIGSPNCFHPEQIIAGFNAGKHVFCEKPLATDISRIQEVVDSWKRSGRTFAFGLVLRYSPIYQKCREILESGALGKIVSLEFNETLTPAHGGYIHGNWRRKRELAGTHILEKCCHDLDLCLWLVESHPQRVASFGGLNFFIPENRYLGEELRDPKTGGSIFETWEDRHRVNPFGEDKDILDNQVVIMEFANQVRASFHTNCNASLIERRFYIVGTMGTLKADARTGIIEYKSIRPGDASTVIDFEGKGGHAGGDSYMAEQLAKTLTEGVPPAAGMAEAIRSLVTAAAIDKAQDLGQVYDLREDWKRLVDSCS